MYRILQIDGGGIKGITPAIVCARIEKEIGLPIYEIFDLITGTSTGSVIGGALAFGMSAEKLEDFYLNEVVELFRKPRSKFNPANWFRAKYDRKKFQDLLYSQLHSQKMNNAKTNYMAATFNLCSQRTHFIKSWDKSDANHFVVDVISWSALSALYYFDKINVPEYQWVNNLPDGLNEQKVGAVFQDGGQGINNCTLGFDLVECLAKDSRDVFILSLGTGEPDLSESYKKMSKARVVRQIIDFISQARNESIPNQVRAANYVNASRNDYEICRLNSLLTKKQDGLDKVKYINKYKENGFELANQVPFDKLR